jgi:hypothetical protein
MQLGAPSVFCGCCGVALDEDTSRPSRERESCPACGSTTRSIHVTVHDGITFKEKLGMKGRHPGSGRPFIEQVSGDDLRRKSGKWMKLSRVIDRDNDIYHEIVVDPSTDEVIHECKEPLSKHLGHGAAKKEEKAN